MKGWEYETETEDLHAVDLRNFIFPFHENTKAFIALVFFILWGCNHCQGTKGFSLS